MRPVACAATVCCMVGVCLKFCRTRLSFCILAYFRNLPAYVQIPQQPRKLPDGPSFGRQVSARTLVCDVNPRRHLRVLAHFRVVEPIGILIGGGGERGFHVTRSALLESRDGEALEEVELLTGRERQLVERNHGQTILHTLTLPSQSDGEQARLRRASARRWGLSGVSEARGSYGKRGNGAEVTLVALQMSPWARENTAQELIKGYQRLRLLRQGGAPYGFGADTSKGENVRGIGNLGVGVGAGVQGNSRLGKLPRQLCGLPQGHSNFGVEVMHSSLRARRKRA